MSYDLAIKLGLALKEGVGVILANGPNMESFITKKKLRLKIIGLSLY